MYGVELKTDAPLLRAFLRLQLVLMMERSILDGSDDGLEPGELSTL